MFPSQSDFPPSFPRRKHYFKFVIHPHILPYYTLRNFKIRTYIQDIDVSINNKRLCFLILIHAFRLRADFLLNVITKVSIYVNAYRFVSSLSLFYLNCTLFHHINIPHFIHSFLYWWVFWLFHHNVMIKFFVKVFLCISSWNLL